MSLSTQQSHQISLSDLLKLSQNPTFSRYLKFQQGPESLFIQSAKEPHKATAEDLTFVSTPEQLQRAVENSAAVIVALEKLKPESIQRPNHLALFSTPSMPAAMAIILPLFDRKLDRFGTGIHPSAVIAATARLGKNVVVSPLAVIGEGCEIGDGARIGSHVVVEAFAKVGANTILHPHCFIGSRCEIGKYCEIHPHVTIGSDGFGFVEGHDQRRHKIPQLGIVVLEDFVEIGGNCAIDRATLGETRIGEGTKFDNLCHVGHNCKIGKHNVFAGGFMVAGSTEIGDHNMVGGGTLITDHVKVGSRMIIGGKAGVTKDLLTPGAYSGYPLEPFKDSMRTLANLVHLTDLRKQVAQIRKHLGLDKE